VQEEQPVLVMIIDSWLRGDMQFCASPRGRKRIYPEGSYDDDGSNP
jgi:hypothetical protein